jgi:hypothetical protein
VLKLSTIAPQTSLGATPSSPPAVGTVDFDLASAAFTNAGLIDQSHPLAANAIKAPAIPADVAAMASPGKSAGKAKGVVKSPEKKQLLSPRAAAAAAAACAHAADRGSTAKVSSSIISFLLNM